MNMVGIENKAWIIDFGATKHICGNRNQCHDYTLVEDRKAHIYLGDSWSTLVLGKGNVPLTFTC